jgi:hypothetical protein
LQSQPEPLLVHPEPNVAPDPVSLKSMSLFERAHLACSTIKALFPEDYECPPDEAEQQYARSAFTSIVGVDPDKGEKVPTPKEFTPDFSAPALRMLDTLLSEYDKELVNSAARIREYVKNKLLEESSNPDGKIRIRALELLGKMRDVGLFSDRIEITHKSKSDDELTDELTKKIEHFMGDAVLVDPDSDENPEDEDEEDRPLSSAKHLQIESILS